MSVSLDGAMVEKETIKGAHQLLECEVLVASHYKAMAYMRMVESLSIVALPTTQLIPSLHINARWTGSALDGHFPCGPETWNEWAVECFQRALPNKNNNKKWEQ